MKLKYLTVFLFFLFIATNVSAQLVITAGTQFSITGNQQVTFQNTDLINNGNFTAGNSLLSFTGNAASNISGTQPLQFNAIEIKKSNNVSLLLKRNISVTQRILFSSGLLNLNSFNADLGSTAQLQGENSNSRIIGALGGEVLFTTNLNAPVASDAANLGIQISSAANLGQVLIKRGHQPQLNTSGSGSSILRYYDVVPANNNNLNAVLRINYFDAELNGLTENLLGVFQKQGSSWLSIGSTIKDTALNFAEKNNINSFSRFTLAGSGVVLPVHFISFNADCNKNKILLTWKTAAEQNSDHFALERSTDGIAWTVIANLPAAGNSAIERSYSFSDNNPLAAVQYQVTEHDKDGNILYSTIVRPSCAVIETFSLLPNPVHDFVIINVVSGSSSAAIIKIFDSKGALVKMQGENIVLGNNHFSIDMRAFANGTYHFMAEWNQGQSKRTITILKQ